MRIYRLLPIFAVLAGAPMLHAQDAPLAASANAVVKSPTFSEVADKALVVMKKRAEELKIKGAAVVAYIEGDSVKSWESKMVVVGGHKNSPTQNDPKGANLIAIAYSKASEMADTLKNSGSKIRPPLNGELGYEGGLISKCKNGYVISAFSGGPSEDDLKVSKAGLDILAASGL